MHFWEISDIIRFNQALKLAKNQKFDEAQKYAHFVTHTFWHFKNELIGNILYHKNAKKEEILSFYEAAKLQKSNPFLEEKIAFLKKNTQWNWENKSQNTKKKSDTQQINTENNYNSEQKLYENAVKNIENEQKNRSKYLAPSLGKFGSNKEWADQIRKLLESPDAQLREDW